MIEQPDSEKPRDGFSDPRLTPVSHPGNTIHERSSGDRTTPEQWNKIRETLLELNRKMIEASKPKLYFDNSQSREETIPERRGVINTHGTALHPTINGSYSSLPPVERIREIVLHRPQASGCLLRCACHRNDCPICQAPGNADFGSCTVLVRPTGISS